VSDVIAVQKLDSVTNGSENGFDLTQTGTVSLIKIQQVAFGSFFKDQHIVQI
jgi:hypothetical protein